MNTQTSERIRQYRQRAIEVRKIADGVGDQTAQQSFRAMANQYDRMADHLEAKDDPSQQ
jgi:hypothetical protein